MLCLSLGRDPTAAKKTSNDSTHSTKTVMPRPPYCGYASLLGSRHRLRICCHAVHSGVPYIPCVVLALAIIAGVIQPQLFGLPRCSSYPGAKNSFPHLHTQFQKECRTVPLVNVIIPAHEATAMSPSSTPVKSRKLARLGRMISAMTVPSQQRRPWKCGSTLQAFEPCAIVASDVGANNVL